MNMRTIFFFLFAILAFNLSAQDNDDFAFYQASTLYKKGEFELKAFQSLYQQDQKNGFSDYNTRSSYFSSFNQFLFGTDKRINYGFDVVFKSNLIDATLDQSRFEVLKFSQKEHYQLLDCTEERAANSPNSRCRADGELVEHDTLRNFDGDALLTRNQIGLSHLGPKIKFHPVKKWSNVTLQQTLYIPIQKHVDGQTVSFTQLFIDKKLNDKNFLFIEASLWTTVAPDFRVLPLIKGFYSYLPTERWTVYAMTTLPVEFGLGTKYRILPDLEIELLYTKYLPIEKILGDRNAMTMNIGVRWTRR